MACCPPGAWGELKPDADYKAKGAVEKLDGGLEVYVTGKAESDKCVIWNYDIFGFNGGRTRQLCDILGEQGFMVILPDYYRGEAVKAIDETLMDFIKKHTVWDNLKADADKVIAFAKAKGAKVFGSVGTCWGTYPVMKLSAYPEFVAGVGMHPSHSPISGAVGDDETKLLEGAKSAQILFMPAGDDHENVRTGGLAEKILGDKLKIVLFEDMKHGWTTKGVLTEANVKRDVDKAVDLLVNHFMEHLKQ